MAYEMPVVNDETVRRLIKPIDSARGWMKLLAVLSIIQGVLIGITIIGLIIACILAVLEGLTRQRCSSVQVRDRIPSFLVLCVMSGITLATSREHKPKKQYKDRFHDVVPCRKSDQYLRYKSCRH